ncbi:uncharacterized protein LOC107827428 isoform X3 [Nicotiana tabacum]|uniref:Uncharacterized protein LOC107827428 isoform X3 n=2 Tax=Nicotiana TaxID=4085 RepID=A0AC58URP4_TOBAC|nr:PREDICTED: uncharacterized protein LOC104237533 isoform X2 [Nicotiana sylvestris]
MAKESKGIIIGTERAYRSSRLSFSVLSVPSAVGAQATQAAERESSCVAKGSTLNRRYAALYLSKHIFALGEEVDDEIVGHVYLFLKEQLEISKMPPLSGVLHGTIIDQFIACGKSRDMAHELASIIWLAVIDNLEENEQTFDLLKRLASEGDVILPFPYSRSYKIQSRVFERLFTDFRDCLNHVEYCDLLACAKQKFQPIPSAWLGY